MENTLFNFYYLDVDETLFESYSNTAWFHLEPCDELGKDKMPSSSKYIQLCTPPEEIDFWWDFLEVLDYKPFTSELNYIASRSLNPNKAIGNYVLSYFYDPPKEFINFKKGVRELELKPTDRASIVGLKLKAKSLKLNPFDAIPLFAKELLGGEGSKQEMYRMKKKLYDLYEQFERVEPLASSESQKTYLMKDSNTGLYKIGKSKNPKHREKTLQGEKPTIKMVKVWNKNIESELHKKYATQRVRGEWFNLTPIQVKYICTSI